MSTAKRDISLARLDESYKNSIAYQYGLFAEKFSYDMLPEKVVHFAKTILLDSIGVMIGALDCDGFPRLTKSIETWGGTKEATILGTGMKTSAGNAALANIFLVHALGYNDLGGGGGHNCSMDASGHHVLHCVIRWSGGDRHRSYGWHPGTVRKA